MRELSLNMMDIVQNSITANATLVNIQELHDVVNNTLLLSVSDNGFGMTAEQVSNVQSPFYTTRTTRKVGLGIPLFKMACEMTGGNLTLESERGVGTKITAEFITGHIDMTPVGDMAETLVLLIAGNPHMDFVYEKRVCDKEYILDTRELRVVLGDDISLSDHDVIVWIREYLAEKELEII